MSLSRPAGILFDLDGVLVDSEPAHSAAWTGLFAEQGVPFSVDDYRNVGAGRSREAVIREVLGDLPADQHARLMERKVELVEAFLQTDGLLPVPGALEFARRVLREGVPAAIATSSRTPALLLGAVGALDLFDTVVDRSMVENGKPAPDLFLRAAEALGLDPADCWVFEDAPAGIEAGLAAGCTVFGLATRHEPAALRRAHHVLRGFDELVWPAAD